MFVSVSLCILCIISVENQQNMGKKRTICRECSKAKFPAISAAKLGHEACLVTAYRVLGVFNERDAYGATPIHYAARGGQLDCLKWLISNSGISPVAAAKNGTTAAHDAAAMGHLTCLQYLVENTKCSPLDRTNEGATVLHMACRFGHVAVTRWLIERGLSSPSEKGDNGVTPVHLCAAKNHLDCLKYLTKSPRYLPDQLTVHGATPVYFAAQEGSLECLQWLVEHGDSDPSIFANDGMGPVHAAAQAGELPCMKWLINHGGISPRQKAEDGATPMHFAASGGKISCLEWLFQNGGSLLDRDDLGGTPLHDAAEQGQIEAVSFILSCGIQKDITDNEGLTPIDLAKDNNHEECMKLFYIKSPTLLNSVTPQHPQNRASANEEEMIRREKQRQFEKAMLSNTTKQEREDMWKEAKENVPEPKQAPPSPLDITSSRRSKVNRNSIDAHRLSLSLINDLIDDHASKERAPLSPELFLDPLVDDNDIGDIVNTEQVGKIVEDNPDIPPQSTAGNESVTKTDEGISAVAHPLTDLIIDNQVDVNPYDIFHTDSPKPAVSDSKKLLKTKFTKTAKPKAMPVSSKTPKATTPVSAPPKSPLKEQQQQQQVVVEEQSTSEAVSPPSSPPPLSGNKKSSSSTSGWRAMLLRLSPRKSKPPQTTPSVNDAAAAATTQSTSSSGNKSKGKKKKGKKKAIHQPENDVAQSKTVQTRPNQKPKKGKKAENPTEGVVMRRHKPSDQVFSHRTSKVEEYAIVSQRRTSTNDEEVAVKFESRPVAGRQSRLSTAVPDEMSSPESSSDEQNHDNTNTEEDLFSPISSTGFSEFGEPIKEDIGQMQEGGESGDQGMAAADMLLEARGSLASLDTMVVHEDMDNEDFVLQNTGSLKDIQIEEEEKEEGMQKHVDAAAVVGTEEPLSVESSVYGSELRPSLSPVRRERKEMMLILEEEEEEEEEDLEGESEDQLTPLPSIIPTHHHHIMDTTHDPMDRYSPVSDNGDHNHTEDEESSEQLNPDVVIKIESVPGFPMPPPSDRGIRSFALVKQMYSDSQAAAVSGGIPSPPLATATTPLRPQQRRHSPVFSPLMVVATVSPRTSLSSVKEEDVTKPDTEKEQAETERDEVRISLTPSQEAAFDDLEKLKDSLMNGNEKIPEENLEQNDEMDRKQTLRTSPAVEELSNMIKGLDNLMEEKSKRLTNGSPPAPPTDHRGHTSTDHNGHSLDTSEGGCGHVNGWMDNESEEISMMGSDLDSLSSTPKQSAKHVDNHQKKEEQLAVTVEIDGFERVQLTVNSSSLVISLIFKAAEMSGLQLTKYHTLFEVHNSLRIERPLEDHESIGEIMLRWPKKNPPHLHLHTFHEKYLLWEKNPLPKGYVGQFLKQGKTPNISSILHYCKGVSGSRGKWSSETHCLGSLGIYQINQSTKSSSSSVIGNGSRSGGSGGMDLVCGTDELLYLPVQTSAAGDWHRYKPLPSRHCFVLKPSSSWKEKDMKIFCCDDYLSYSQWISGIRLVKHGLQLKCNYVAMCKRLEPTNSNNAVITNS